MRNTTLEVEKEELQSEIKRLRTRQFRQLAFVLFILFVWTVYQWPKFYEDMLEDGTMMTVLCSVFSTLLVSRFLL